MSTLPWILLPRLRLRPCVRLRTRLRAASLGLCLGIAALSAAQAQALITSVGYQGQRFELTKAYADFHEDQDDPQNLSDAQGRQASALMRGVKMGPRFGDRQVLDAALAALAFPGYGLFCANQLGTHPGRGPGLELVYVELPRQGLNRYLALERHVDGAYVVVADVVAAAEPEITGVGRAPDGTLRFHDRQGARVVPAPR